MQTLSEKQAALLDTVALPTADDWQLIPDDRTIIPALVEQLNAHLAAVLAEYKAKRTFVWGDLARAIFAPLKAMERDHQAGIMDSEGMQTVARFFAVNYDPSLYDFLRYGGENPLRGLLPDLDIKDQS